MSDPRPSAPPRPRPIPLLLPLPSLSATMSLRFERRNSAFIYFLQYIPIPSADLTVQATRPARLPHTWTEAIGSPTATLQLVPHKNSTYHTVARIFLIPVPIRTNSQHYADMQLLWIDAAEERHRLSTRLPGRSGSRQGYVSKLSSGSPQCDPKTIGHEPIVHRQTRRHYYSVNQKFRPTTRRVDLIKGHSSPLS